MTKSDLDKVLEYLERDWTGEHGGPVVTLELLLSHKGLFEIPHLLLTYIEHLSTIISGRDGNRPNYTDVIDFFKKYFPPSYEKASPWLIYIYRHGFVHQYKPKDLRVDDRRAVAWAVSNEDHGKHLRLTKRGNLVFLPISNPQFIVDFKQAVQKLIEVVKRDVKAQKRIITGYQKFQTLEKLDDINKPYIHEDDKDWLRAAFGKEEGS